MEDKIKQLEERINKLESNITKLFGKSLTTGGNIDLYRHVIKGEALNGGTWGASVTKFMLTVISSKNLKVTSLTNLKTLLGNTFEYPATGYYEGNATAMWKINQDVVTDIDYPSPTSISLTEFTFTDTVTPV